MQTISKATMEGLELPFVTPLDAYGTAHYWQSGAALKLKPGMEYITSDGEGIFRFEDNPEDCELVALIVK